MIYYSEEVISIWQPNVIMLDLLEDLGHVYVTKDTYDQAIVINDRFDSNVDSVMMKLGLPDNQPDVTSFLKSVLPSPLNILVPFYNLIDNSVGIDIEDMKQTVGVLSYIATSINFLSMLKVPKEVRASVSFTKSILLDYQGHYEDFVFKISNAPSHILPEGMMPPMGYLMPQMGYPMQGEVQYQQPVGTMQQTSMNTSASPVAEEHEVVVDISEEELAALLGDLDFSGPGSSDNSGSTNLSNSGNEGSTIKADETVKAEEIKKELSAAEKLIAQYVM